MSSASDAIRYFVLALVVTIVAGCGDEAPAPAHDLSAVADLAAPDLSVVVPFDRDMMPPRQCGYPPDMFARPNIESFCAFAPRVDGTCVQAFFRKIAACFAPAGCCWWVGNSNPEWTWASGAYSRAEPITGYRALYQDGLRCGAIGFDAPDDRWTAWDGTTLRFDRKTNVATCPDGTTVELGNDAGGCAELAGLLAGFGGSEACPQYSIDPDAAASCCTPYPVFWRP